ncbi:GH12 family glycosyl hydrolase domain-containing protein [Streptomyces fenghuangensis]|uniref:Cellulose binding domain-containing protein n=1 Tax=Streptomyces chitinivorans TaxID=1257027 RepID=A0ABW7HVP2_9ACTN|nr:cellulose binding domain-containing protein [Streptomyces chitinivorans]MDH2407844.1 cellulose binding domain-containing protein [Streptomyces chitinivorans]
MASPLRTPLRTPLRSLPRTRAVLLALLLLAGALTALTATAQTARADERICDQYGSTTIQGKYVVQNNRWGTSATQCIDVTGTGFRLAQADGSVPTDGAPKSYPSVFYGCHYTNCSPGTNLPMQVSSIGSAPSSISYTYVDNAVYNASYDIWLDPTPKKDGVNRTEIMIWLNRVGPIQPIGSRVGTANVGGRSWEVWTGSNGSNDVISFIAPSAVRSMSFDVMDFVDETVARGMAQRSWYMTSVQAGFEPWQNGAGLAVDSFSASVNAGSGGGDGGGDDGGPGGEPGACEVTYTTNSWSNGFTADVGVRNTGSTAISGWEMSFALPAGQSVTNAWNATLSSSGGTVTARPVEHNRNIEPGGTQSFGFQGTHSGGTPGEPTRFTLNGTVCTVK